MIPSAQKNPAVKTVIDGEMLKVIALFEQVTRARVKDVFHMKEILTFVVYEGDMIKALGPQLAHLHKIEQLLQRKVKIVEYNANLIRFLTNLLYPYKVSQITQEEKTIIISDSDAKTKGLIIGSKAQNLRMYESIVKKYFEIDEIKVV